MARKRYGTVDLAGITGAVQATRWVGSTTSGPPTTGTFAIGDFVVDRQPALWLCTSAGSPGTWVLAGGVLSGSLASIPAAAASNAGMLYLSVDGAAVILYRSNGSAWSQAAAAVNLNLTTKGDLQTFSTAATRLPVGTPGQVLMPDSNAATGLAWVAPPQVTSITSAIAETIPARIGGSATVAAGASGQLRLQSIWLPSRAVITSITFVSGSTALTSGTHGWAALYGPGLSLLRQSPDDTGITWTNAATHTFTLNSTVTISAAGWFYIGLMVTSTGNMPTLTGAAGSGTLNGLALISSGTSTGSLTATAPDPAAALTAVGGVPYAYVS